MQEVVLVRTTRRLLLSNALFQRGISNPPYHQPTFIPKGAIGMIEGTSPKDNEYKVIAFEHPHLKGVSVTDEVWSSYLVEA